MEEVMNAHDISKLLEDLRKRSENTGESDASILEDINIIMTLMDSCASEVNIILNTIPSPDGSQSVRCFRTKIEDLHKTLSLELTTLTLYWAAMMACFSSVELKLYPIVSDGFYYMLCSWARNFREKLTSLELWIASDDYFTEISNKVVGKSFMDPLLEGIRTFTDYHRTDNPLFLFSKVDSILKMREDYATDKSREIITDIGQLKEFATVAESASAVLSKYQLVESSSLICAQTDEIEGHIQQLEEMQKNYSEMCSYINALRLLRRGDLSIEAFSRDQFHHEKLDQQSAEVTNGQH